MTKETPAFCLLVVSKKCNFRCKMCNMWKNASRHRPDERPEMTIDEIKGFVTDLTNVTREPIFIHLIGGEALLREDLIEIIRFIKDTGFNSSITTNGFYIDERMAERLAGSGIRGVFLSMDGFKPETHDYLRGVKGSHAQVHRAIGLLDKYRGDSPERMSIGITMTMMEKNLDEVLDLVEWANGEPRINDLFLNACLQPFDCDDYQREWYRSPFYKEIWPQDPARVQDLLEKLAQLKEKGYKICNPPEQLRLIKNYFTNPYRFIHDARIKCPRGDLAPEVNAYGDINMCFAMPPVANIRQRKFSEVWFSEDMAAVRRQINACKKDCDIAVNCFYKIENITNPDGRDG